MPSSMRAASEVLPAQNQLPFNRNTVPLLVVAKDSFRILAANEAAGLCYGYAVQHLIGMNLEAFFDAEEWPHLLHALQTYALQQVENRLWLQRGLQGAMMQVEIDLTTVEVQDVVAYIFLIRNMSPEPRQVQECAVVGEHRHAILEGLEDGFFHLDRDARFTFVNQRAKELLHKGNQDLVGRVIWDCFPEAVETDHYHHFKMALQGHLPISYELYYPPWKAWHEVRVYASAQGFSVSFRDVTQRHRQLERINQERDWFNALVNSSNDAIISINSQGTIQTFNPGAERIFGMRREVILGHDLDQLLPERFRVAHAGFRAEFAQSKCPQGRMMGLGRVKGLRADGVEIDLEGSIVNMQIGGQLVLITTLRDVTDDLLAEAEQEVMRNRLSQLTHRLMSQEKDMVKRISQALHDQLGQTMAAIRIVHETIATVRPHGDQATVSRLFDQLGTLIDQAIQQVRVVLTDLQPPMLGEHGLAAALDNEMRNRARAPASLQLILQVSPDVARVRWPAAVEHAVFMIAREAMENAMRHSGGSRLNMTLTGDPAALILEVWDDGCGFTPKLEAGSGHLGLTGMSERASSIGAQLTMKPSEMGGAHLTLHWYATP